MKENNYLRTKRACQFANVAIAPASCLSPLLFMPFHELYGISYTLLGTLVLVNFLTQLSIDLIFSFFSKRFNIKLAVKIMPIITTIGFILFAFSPWIFGDSVYIGLIIGTMIFSVSAGLCEVLISPIIATLPNATDKDMSGLHALYPIGVILVVCISSLFLRVFGNDKWQCLVLFWASVPVISAILFFISPLPDMRPVENTAHTTQKPTSVKKVGLLLCVLCIFLGAAAECTMTAWISSYMEKALGLSKTIGDILGMALFALLLGLGRILYTKFGKNIFIILIVGMSGAFVCYLICGLVTNVVVSFIACVMTGLCASMLWPGSLILMEEKIDGVGVSAYALMAAGGDLGASVAPQMVGAIVDNVGATSWAKGVAEGLSITSEQLAMKFGMLITALFPLIGVVVLLIMRSYFKRNSDGKLDDKNLN